MDPTKIVVLGAGPGFGRIDAALTDSIIVEHKTRLPDFAGDVMVLPRRVPEEHSWSDRRGKSGAARIKRNAKQRRNRKGK